MPTLLLTVLLGQLTPMPLSDGGPLGLDDLRTTADGRFVLPEGELGTVRVATITPGQPSVDVRVPFDGPGLHKVSSATVAGGLLIASDRVTKAIQIKALDPALGATAVTQALAAGPDYVRAFRGEIWVTEPGKDQIEVFALTRKPVKLQQIALLSAPSPESLELDDSAGVVYTLSEDKGRMIGFDMAKHAQVSDWAIACPGKPKGLALSGDGLAFVGCSDGAALAISLKTGAEVSRLPTGTGVDIIAFNRAARRLYVPGAKSATLTIVSVAANGALTKLRELPTTPRAHCVAATGGVVLVCDPPHGRLLRLDDQ